MNESYYFVRDGKSLGPFTLDELLLQDINQNTFIWTKGMKDWVNLKDVTIVYERYNQLNTMPQIPTDIPNPNIHKPENIPILGDFVTNFQILLYLFWFLIHFIILLVNWNNWREQTSEFWPFNDYQIMGYYDLTEFIAYTITPIIVFMIIFLLKSDNKLKKE